MPRPGGVSLPTGSLRQLIGCSARYVPLRCVVVEAMVPYTFIMIGVVF